MEGQGSIEYLTIYAAVLVVFGAVTFPQMVNPGQEASREVGALAQARDASDRIADTINGAYSSSEGFSGTEFVKISRGWRLKICEENVQVSVLFDGEIENAVSELKYGFSGGTLDLQSGSYSVIVEWNEGKPEEMTLDSDNNLVYINIRPGS